MMKKPVPCPPSFFAGGGGAGEFERPRAAGPGAETSFWGFIGAVNGAPVMVAPAAPAHIIGKAFSVVRIVRQKIEPLALHLATAAAVEAAHLQLQENPRVAARQIAHPANLAIVPAHLDATATAARRFFERRLSQITRAFGSVLYKRASRLFADLAQARGEGRLLRLMNTLERTNLIIIDDWGPEPLTADQRRDLLEIVDDRYDKGSLLITSQVPVSQWHDVIADPTLGDAILDRIVHNAHRIELKGDSLRRRAGEKTKL